jgi:hypothetical protein
MQMNAGNFGIATSYLTVAPEHIETGEISGVNNELETFIRPYCASRFASSQNDLPQRYLSLSRRLKSEGPFARTVAS